MVLPNIDAPGFIGHSVARVPLFVLFIENMIKKKIQKIKLNTFSWKKYDKAIDNITDVCM